MTDLQTNLFEELKPAWTLPSLLVSPQRLFRKSFGDDRAYLRPLDNKGLVYQIAAGLTSAIKHCVPLDAKQIQDWEHSIGRDAANLISDEARCYGTMLHILCSNLVGNGFIDFTELNDIVALMIPARFAHNLKYWQNRARKNLASICQAFSDKQVKPLFSEYCIFDSELNIGTFIDFGCEMTFNRKTVVALWDFKFTRSGTFGEAYFAQAGFVKNLYNRHAKANGLPEAEMTFLVCPKEFNEKKGSEPTYGFENCTGGKYDTGFMDYMKLWQLKKSEVLGKIEGTERYAHSIYSIGDTFETDKHFTTVNYQYQI